jgi:hypothetical protein
VIKRVDAPILKKGQGLLFLAGHFTYFLGPMVDDCRRLWRFTPTYGLPRKAIATTRDEDPSDEQLLALLETEL